MTGGEDPRIARTEEDVRGYMASETDGPATHVHIEPTWQMAEHLRKKVAA